MFTAVDFAVFEESVERDWRFPRFRRSDGQATNQAEPRARTRTRLPLGRAPIMASRTGGDADVRVRGMSPCCVALLPLLIATSGGCCASAPAESAPGAAATSANPDSTQSSPAAAPWSEDRACRQDSDCVLLAPPPCACPPCGLVLRDARNRKTGEKLKRRWEEQDHDCSVRGPCPACAGTTIGSKAVCAKQQCVAVP